MNFDAAVKLSADCVTNLLQSIKDSEGTQQYLKIMRYILNSFIKKDLPFLERIYQMWYSTFFLRIWKHWLKENNLSIEKNFLTSNTYTCIELNSHGLLIMLEKCRRSSSKFIPWLYSSQPCEKIFRQTRSMTTTFSTIVNFNFLDLLRRLNKIQVLNEISTDLSE